MNLVILWIHDFFIWISIQKIFKKIVPLENTFSMPYHSFSIEEVKSVSFWLPHTFTYVNRFSILLHCIDYQSLAWFNFALKHATYFIPKRTFCCCSQELVAHQNRVTTPQWFHIMVLDKGDDGKNTCCIMLIMFCNLFLLHILCVLQLVIIFEKFVTYKNTLKWHKIGGNICFPNAKTRLTKDIWGPIFLLKLNVNWHLMFWNVLK